MISIIVAIGKNNEIGINNEMPWHLPADLQYFKKVTTGHPIVMGRKTYESIGRPLPNRKNIILTKDRNFHVENCFVHHSIDEIIKTYENENIFIIGGAQLYKQFMPFVDKLYVTHIDASFENADTYFPHIGSEWKVVSVEKHQADESNHYDFKFVIYERQRKN